MNAGAVDTSRAASAASPVLRAEGLHMAFGGIVALNEVSIDVRADELVAIIGPNGAGKTSLMNCLGGFYRPQRGRILFSGEDVSGHGVHQLARAQIRQQRRAHVRSPTSLISETWLKLAGADFSVENRAHLVALVARAMRFVLLDEVRRALAEKRGEGMDLLPLDETTEPVQTSRLE